jgi:cytochrome c
MRRLDEPRCPTARRLPGAPCALLVLLALAAACGPNRIEAARALTGGEPERGRELCRRYSCGSCHVIPGVSEDPGKLGPTLVRVAERPMLGGQVPNTPDNMKQWIRDPHAMKRGSGMPKLGVNDSDARDLAAFMYTLR